MFYFVRPVRKHSLTYKLSLFEQTMKNINFIILGLLELKEYQTQNQNSNLIFVLKDIRKLKTKDPGPVLSLLAQLSNHRSLVCNLTCKL